MSAKAANVCRYSFNPFVTSRTYMSHLPSFFKYARITASQFFSMLPSTLKYVYSVEPVRMHFPAKQPYCTAALHTVSFVHGCFAGKCILTGSSEYRYFKVNGSMEKKWDTVIPADLKRLFVSETYMSRWS